MAMCEEDILNTCDLGQSNFSPQQYLKYSIIQGMPAHLSVSGAFFWEPQFFQ
jgi:hypothetical protein